MAKKVKHPEHENLERWLVSYADFMTLLFATFTALFAMAQNDLSKLKDISVAIKQGFEEQSLLNGIKTIFEGKSAPNDNPKAIAKEKGAGAGVIGKYDSLTYKPGEVKKVSETYENLKKDVNDINKQIETVNQEEGRLKKPEISPRQELPAKGISVAIQERGMKVSMDSRMLFESGSASIKPSAYTALDKISERLKPLNQTNLIYIEGHTDDQPVSSGQFPSNWELSSARAAAVIRFMVSRHDFNPKTLVAVGYGDTRPISSNLTPEGRQNNRRVDIVIYSQVVGEKINPTQQFNTQTDLIKSEAMGENNMPLPKTDSSAAEGSAPDIAVSPAKAGPAGPVKVVIKERNGSERVIEPAHKKVDFKPRLDKISAPVPPTPPSSSGH